MGLQKEVLNGCGVKALFLGSTKIGLCSAALLVVLSEVANGCGVRAVIFVPWRLWASSGGSPGGAGGVHLGASGVPLEAYIFILVVYYT